MTKKEFKNNINGYLDEYLENLKDIKEKQRMFKAKRIESLKLKGPQYYSVKIENKGIDKTTYNAKYCEEEIDMAKKCLLNKWEFPPMEYLDQRYAEKKAKERQRQLELELEQEEKNKKKKKEKEKTREKEKEKEKDKEKEKKE